MLRIDETLSCFCIIYRGRFHRGTAFSVSQFTTVDVPVPVPDSRFRIRDFGFRILDSGFPDFPYAALLQSKRTFLFVSHMRLCWMKGRAEYEVEKISSVSCVLHPQPLKKSAFILTKVLGISLRKYFGKTAFCRERRLFKKTSYN